METAPEALDRYYEEESSARGGLFTPGGASAGGIFGDGQIATEQFDGAAAHRHLSAVRTGLGSLKRELAASRRVNAKLLKRVEELERKQLGGRSRGRRRAEDDLDEELDEDLDDDDDDDLY